MTTTATAKTNHLFNYRQ